MFVNLGDFVLILINSRFGANPMVSYALRYKHVTLMKPTIID